MLKPANNLHLRTVNFSADGLAHRRCAASVIFACDHQRQTADRRVRAHQFAHPVGQHHRRRGIAFGIHNLAPFPHKAHDRRRVLPEVRREPSVQRRIHGCHPAFIAHGSGTRLYLFLGLWTTIMR